MVDTKAVKCRHASCLASLILFLVSSNLLQETVCRHDSFLSWLLHRDREQPLSSYLPFTTEYSTVVSESNAYKAGNTTIFLTESFTSSIISMPF